MSGMQNVLPGECVGVVATVDPDALGIATHDSDWVDMGEFDQIMAIAAIGTLGASATATVSVVQATDSSGTGAKAITGKAATALTQASPDDSDKQIVINVRAEELDLDNGFTHAALRIVVGTAASDGGGVVLGFGPRYFAQDYDLASVAEIVN